MAINPLFTVNRGTHEASALVTPAQLLAAGEAHIGQKIRLPVFAEVQTIVVGDDSLVMKFYRFDRKVSARETTTNAAYTCLWSFYLVAGAWVPGDTFQSEQADFVPYTVPDSARPVRDENEQAVRRAYEAACHRPGTGSAPMDNADRTAEGYTTDSMRKHWA